MGIFSGAGSLSSSIPYPYFLNLATSLFVLSASSGVTSEGSAPSPSFSTGTAVDSSSMLSKKSSTPFSVIIFSYRSTRCRSWLGKSPCRKKNTNSVFLIDLNYPLIYNYKMVFASRASRASQQFQVIGLRKKEPRGSNLKFKPSNLSRTTRCPLIHILGFLSKYINIRFNGIFRERLNSVAKTEFSRNFLHSLSLKG